MITSDRHQFILSQVLEWAKLRNPAERGIAA